MKKRVINYIDLRHGGCGLTTDSRTETLRQHGMLNVKSFRPATQKDIDWVRGMGGMIPDGYLQQLKGKP